MLESKILDEQTEMTEQTAQELATTHEDQMQELLSAQKQQTDKLDQEQNFQQELRRKGQRRQRNMVLREMGIID